MQSFGIMMTNRISLRHTANEKVATMGIVMKVNMIAVLVLVGFAFGGRPLIGYNYGANNKSGLRIFSHSVTNSSVDWQPYLQ